MNPEIMKAAGFGREVEMVKNGICPFCGGEVDYNDFRDELSIKEFKISGLCQQCQDETFGGE